MLMSMNNIIKSIPNLGIVADTYTYDKYPNNNYEQGSAVVAKCCGGNFSRRSYLHFKVNESKNKLRVFTYSTGTVNLHVQTPQTLRIYFINPISINNITWNNQDSYVTERELLCEVTLTGDFYPKDPIDFDFNRYVNGGDVYLEIQQLNSNNKNFLANSKEHTDSGYEPVLL